MLQMTPETMRELAHHVTEILGTRVLCGFPSPLWARSVRPQGCQRPHERRTSTGAVLQ